MENNLNFEYKGFKANGFVVLFTVLAVLAGCIACLATQVASSVLAIVMCAIGIAVALVTPFGLMVIEPNQARVMVFFGKYRGNLLQEGFWWVNPFMSVKKISLRARNLNPEPIKVNDKAGNPVLIGMVLVWRLKDTYKALFDIDSETTVAQLGGMAGARMNMFEKFVAVQSDAALRQVAGMYAYDENGAETGEVTLRGGGDVVNDLLTEKLNERLSMAGLEVVEARINYLAYAPEIAAVMLRRQQAAAIISAREKIVEGAVSMVKLALDKLNEDNIVELDEEKKAAMVSNLLVVLCSEENAQPVINSGTLNH